METHGELLSDRERARLQPQNSPRFDLHELSVKADEGARLALNDLEFREPLANGIRSFREARQ